MKFFFVLPAMIGLLLSALYGQAPIRTNPPLVLISSGYVINAGLGFSNYTTSTIANIASVNPASIADFSRTSVGMSFLFATKIDSAVGGIAVSLDRVNPLLLQAFGAVIPYKNLRFGLGFNQKYSGSLGYEETFQTFPDSASEIFNLLFETYVYSGSGIIAYSLPRFISVDHGLSLGLQINVDFLKRHEEAPRLSAEGKDQNITWKAGVRYRFLDLLQSSIAFEKGSDFSGTIKYSGEAVLQHPDSGFIFQPLENKFTAKLPDRLLMGLAFKISGKIRLANDFTYIYWEKINSLQKNQLDISGNFYFLPSEKLSLSAGFYSTRREVKDLNTSDDNAFFLSAGILARIKSAEIEAVLADSHLFSSDTRKQTLGRLSVGFSL